MSVEVLVSTMNMKNDNIISQMNLDSDAIVINQCNEFGYRDLNINRHFIKVFSFNEKGIGLSRNNALLRSKSEFVIFSDDDMEFYRGYSECVSKWFERIPRADMLIFNIDSNDQRFRKNTKVKKVNFFNSLNYGAVRFVCRSDVIKHKNICFSTLFGGGSKYSCGEDSLFLCDCLRKKLKVYTVPESIAKLNVLRESTWFKGYNEKYFFDNGVFWACTEKKFGLMFAIAILIKNFKYYKNDISFKKALNNIVYGYKYIKNKNYLSKR